MKRVLSVVLTLMILLSLIPGSVFAAEPFTRADAAVFLAESFALADIHALQLEGMEETPKELGYAASSEAITAKNVIAAAKDCVKRPDAPKIEAVVNALLLPLDVDGLSFKPDAPITVREMATAVAKGMYGADLKIDHLKKAIDDGLFKASDITDEPITKEQVGTLFAFLKETKLVAMFATADIHGNYIPYRSSDGKFEIGSVARIKTVMDEVRTAVGKDNVIYVDGGDSPYNTTLANVTLGKVSVDALNALGLNATVLGNHDFDYSLQNLLSLRDRASYAMLSANTKFREGKVYEGEKTYPFGDYITVTAGGLKFGIFGVTDDKSAETTLYTNTRDIEWDNDLAKATELVGKLKDEEKCDVVVALSHLHSKNTQLVTDNKAVDISIGGGNDIAGRPTIVNDTQYLINPSKHGEALNQINVVVYNGKMTGVVYNQIFLTDAYKEDAAVKKLIDDYNAEVGKALEEVVGYSAQQLEWSTQLVRAQNSPIANLVTDALLDFFADYEPDICLVNGGGMRSSIPEGEVTLKVCNSVLPFDNDMMLVEAPGEAVLAALENGVSALPSLHGKFAQPAGITYTADLTKEPGKRVSDVKFKDGTPLDPSKRYKVVINSFIAGGGDGYTMLNVLNKEAGIAEDVRIITHVNKTYMRHALQAYFEKSTKENPVKVDLNEVRIKIIEQPFTDVSKSDWFYADMLAMYHAGVINGTSETTFEPEGMVTRAQFITMLYRLDGEKKVEDATSTFTDVRPTAYYCDAVNWGVKAGITNGVTQTEFAPHENITREQIATMLFRYAAYAKKADLDKKVDLNEKFHDSAAVSGYARAAVEWAAAVEVVRGDDTGAIRPKDNATRAEAAALMVRVGALPAAEK